MQSLTRKPEAPQIRVLLKLYLVHLLEMRRSQPLRALSLKLLISDELCTSREATFQCRPLHTAEKEEVILVELESPMGKADLPVEEKGATRTSTASASSATSMATRR